MYIVAFVIALVAMFVGAVYTEKMFKMNAKATSKVVLEDPQGPEILVHHEHPLSVAHYNSGPHFNCHCRVCELQFKNLHLELELDRLRKRIPGYKEILERQTSNSPKD